MDIQEFQLERYLAKHEFAAPHLLCTSDCETMTVNDLLTLDTRAMEGFLNLRLGYTESQGNPQLRKEISELYTGIRPEEIAVSAGAEEAIFLSMHVLLDPGDHVIVQTPAYQSLSEIPASIGCQVSGWELKEKDGKWTIDLEELRAMITRDTKLIVVNSPHNPTGHLFSLQEWKELVEIAGNNDIRIISDEVYRGLEHDPEDQLPAIADCTDTGISIGVMSKAFGLAGIRIGWIATKDQKFMRSFLSQKDYTTICSSGPSEYLAMVALQHKETILRRNRSIALKNIGYLAKFFKKNESVMKWSPPRAGSTAFPHLTRRDDIDRFCDHVREEAGVLLLPGKVFGVTGSYFRIGYGRIDMKASLDALDKYLA